jgi:hypothetical protein
MIRAIFNVLLPSLFIPVAELPQTHFRAYLNVRNLVLTP